MLVEGDDAAPLVLLSLAIPPALAFFPVHSTLTDTAACLDH